MSRRIAKMSCNQNSAASAGPGGNLDEENLFTFTKQQLHKMIEKEMEKFVPKFTTAQLRAVEQREEEAKRKVETLENELDCLKKKLKMI